jgi:hypothetical protein
MKTAIPFVLYFSHDGPSCSLFMNTEEETGTLDVQWTRQDVEFQKIQRYSFVAATALRNVTGRQLVDTEAQIQHDQHMTSGSWRSAL